MISKKSVAVISFLAIVSLTSIGFSTFYIIPSTETSINTSIGDVLDFNELVKNKLVTYTITENGFIHSEDNIDTIVKDKAEITLSFQLDTYEIQEVLNSFSSSFTFYIELYESGSGILSEPSIASYTIFYTYTSGSNTSNQTFSDTSTNKAQINSSFSDNVLLTCTLTGLTESDTNISSLDVSLEISFNLESGAFDNNYDNLISSNYFYFYVGVDI